MARYRKIDVRIWNDRKFRELSDNGKLAFILLLTHPDTTQLGTIRARVSNLADELGWSSDVMSHAIQDAKSKGMIDADEKAGLIVINNFLKYNAPSSPNAFKSWCELIDLMPECNLLDKYVASLRGFVNELSPGMKKSIPNDLLDAIRDAMSHANEQSSRIQEQEQYINVATQHMSAEEKAPSADPRPEPPREETLTPNPDTAAELTPAQRAVRVGKHCPQQKLIDLYHECLPSLPRVRMWNTAKRRQSMAARWREMSRQEEFQNEAEGLDFFRRFFRFVGHSPFLMGQTKDKSGRSFVADLEWLMNADNFTKICERKYHDR